MRNYAYLALLLFISSKFYAQLTPAPFSDACTDGDLYQVVSGELIEYNFDESCNFIGTTICDSYIDQNGDPINITEYNSLGFNENDNLLYALTRNEELVVIGMNCVAEIKGPPIIDVPAGAPCENVNSFPNTFSATFDNAGNAWVLDNTSDILYQLDVSTNTAVNCIEIAFSGNNNNVTNLADIAYDPVNDRFIGINGSTLYSINPSTGIVTTQALTGTSANDTGPVGSIFGLADGTIIAFYNSTGNYYQIDPDTGTATFLENTASNGSNDGTSCSQVNIFCPDPLVGTATPTCFDENNNAANVGEYYIELETNYDPNNTSATSATPDFTIIANGVVETTTYDGFIIILGPYTSESVVLEIKETDDGDISTKDFCVDVVEVIQVDEIPCANVPVELLSFEGKFQEGKTWLYWQTASELNNDYFFIERSHDGKTFEAIGKVKGSGNSLTIKSYNFQDDISIKDLNYYRLKQIDFNGSYEYSEIILVDSENSISKLEIFPSPVRDQLFISWTKKAQVYRIMNLNGVEIRSFEGDRNELIEIDVSDLPVGVYLLEGIQDGERKIVKFMKSN